MTSTISFDKDIGGTWTKIDEVGDGATWHIQPTNKDCRYLIIEEDPTTQDGGIICKGDQLDFAKVSGDLWLKDGDGLGKTHVYISMQEEAE